MPGWRVAPAVLMDSPVPKSNIVADAKDGGGERKSGVKRGGCAAVPPVARKALENAGKASMQVFSSFQKYKLVKCIGQNNALHSR